MSLLYKTLFEVKLAHEFFITDEKGATGFDEPDQQKRLDFLMGDYSWDLDSIDRDLTFEFPGSFTSDSKRHSLKLLPAWSGCKVMIRVNQKILADGSLVFEPFSPLPDDLDIYLSLSKKNNLIDNYTNSRVGNAIPALYFFSNEPLPGAKPFPFLVNTIAAGKFDYSYEQGELIRSGTSTIMEYYKDATGADAWRTIPGQAFVNEADRLLLPLRFNYSFVNAAGLTQADFVLKDRNGNTLKAVSVGGGGTANLSTVSLDFSDVAGIVSLPGHSSVTDAVLFLVVSGNGGYSASFPVIFGKELYDRSNWGLIHCRIKPADASFNLLGDDGFLLKRKGPAGIWSEAPVFEIPIKSRLGYWRYINNAGKELDLAPDLTGYLFKADGNLLTKTPRPLSKYYFLLEDDTGTQTKYLPNPVDYTLRKDDKDRVCFDIKVPKSDLFPTL